MPAESTLTMQPTQSPRERELRGHGTRRYQLPMHGDSNPKLCECGCGQPAPIAKDTSQVGQRKAGEPQRFVAGHSLRGVWAGRKHTAESLRLQSQVKRGALNANWKGGSTIINGRRLIHVGRDHPLANANGYALEHRLVMSNARGWYLQSHEHVHHINGYPLDNRIENLLVMTKGQHKRIHNLMRFGSSHADAVRQTLGIGVYA